MRIVAEDNRIVHDVDPAQLMQPSAITVPPDAEEGDLLYRRRADGGVYAFEDRAMAYGRLCSR